MNRLEQEILARDPRLLPLGLLLGCRPKLGNAVICYHLDELAAGRPTIFGTKNPEEYAFASTRWADSLLDVLHRYYLENHAATALEYNSLRNRGAGSPDRQDLERAESYVEQIEELRRWLVERTGQT